MFWTDHRCHTVVMLQHSTKLTMCLYVWFYFHRNDNHSYISDWYKHWLLETAIRPIKLLSIYKFKKVTRCVRSFVCSFVTLASFSSLWPAFTLNLRIISLYNESVHGREENATWINSIPLKIATLLTLQTLKWVYSFATDVLIVSATSRHYSVTWRAGRFGHDHFGTECRSKRQFGSLIRYS